MFVPVPVKNSQSLGTGVTDGYGYYVVAGQHVLGFSKRSKCSETLSCLSSPHSQVFYCSQTQDVGQCVGRVPLFCKNKNNQMQ